MKEARFHYTICLLNEGSFSLLEEYREKGNARDMAFECLFSGDGCTKKKYNHRNFCIHMATSHGFDSVAQIMARHPHPGMKSVQARLFPELSLVKESSPTEIQEDDLTLEEVSASSVQKPVGQESSGLSTGKPAPKPMVETKGTGKKT